MDLSKISVFVNEFYEADTENLVGQRDNVLSCSDFSLDKSINVDGHVVNETEAKTKEANW